MIEKLNIFQEEEMSESQKAHYAMANKLNEVIEELNRRENLPRDEKSKGEMGTEG